MLALRSIWRQVNCRRLCTAYASSSLPGAYDEADWSYSGEWWGSQDGGFGRDEGQTVFQAYSRKGNGLVTVTAHPASLPIPEEWPGMEAQLQQKLEKLVGIFPNCRVKIQGFQWRVLRFNNVTRESVAKVMLVYADAHPGEIFLKQQPHCLAFPYVKSMLATGLTALSSTKFDLTSAVSGEQQMRILCIGHGGGTIPLFLASTIKGAIIDVVEVDEAVISASINYMGCPAILKSSYRSEHLFTTHRPSENYASDLSLMMQRVLWGGFHNRIFLYEADGEAYISKSLLEDEAKHKGSFFYDIVFIDAYDGDDKFPYKFRDKNGKFLKSLRSKLHPSHGTVVVNLHADSVCSSQLGLFGEHLPIGMGNMKVAETYKNALAYPHTKDYQSQANTPLAFTTTAPTLANVTLAVTRNFCLERSHLNNKDGSGRLEPSCGFSEEQVFKKLLLESERVQNLFNFHFDCSQYVLRGFFIVR